MERVKKYDQKGEKIKVLPVFNQKLQMRGISKGRRHSRWGGAPKQILTLLVKLFVQSNFFTENVNYLIIFRVASKMMPVPAPASRFSLQPPG